MIIEDGMKLLRKVDIVVSYLPGLKGTNIRTAHYCTSSGRQTYTQLGLICDTTAAYGSAGIRE